MDIASWTLVYAVEYGILATLFILIFYAYTGWLLKHNYRKSWENWFVAGKNLKKNIAWVFYTVPIIIFLSLVFSGPFGFFDSLIISLTVSTTITIRVYHEEEKSDHRLSTKNILKLWFELAVPFTVILWGSGYVFKILSSIMGGNL